MMRVLLAAVLFALIGFGSLATTAGAQDIDCTDVTYEDAQAIWAQDPSDPYWLDGNKNGVACESNAPGGSESGNGNDTDAAADNSDDAEALSNTNELAAVGTGPAASSSETLIVTLAVSALLCGAVANHLRVHVRR